MLARALDSRDGAYFTKTGSKNTLETAMDATTHANACPECGGKLRRTHSRPIAGTHLREGYQSCVATGCNYRERVLIEPEKILKAKRLM